MTTANTNRQLTLVDVVTGDGVDADDVMCLVGALEAASYHPIGQAIAVSARQRIGDLPGVRGFVSTPGLGVTGIVAGHRVVAGRQLFLADNGMVVPSALLAAATAAQDRGRTPILAGWEGLARAVIVLADAVEPPTSNTARSDAGCAHDSADGITPALVWGLVVGALNAALPFAAWWLDQTVVHALIITLVAAVYVGFAVADGRKHVIAVECSIAAAFAIVAATAVSATPWLLVAAYAAHGLKDLWQLRRRFVTGTRWWPPFCVTVDWFVALIVTIEIIAGLDFH